ncbi:MAG TPA: c-type cytochrome domain-containing protein [Bryobacteraceae bacterium]|nr:c-type cytochrome domain-containing protein [Bryobacteraceae bacterium]
MRPVCRLALSLILILIPSSRAAEPSFTRDVRPLLQRSCQGCHQPNLKMSGLDLTTYSGLVAGGKRGTGVKAAAPAESLILKYINGDIKPQMPIGQPALPADQIAVVRDWIAAGAKDDSPAQTSTAAAPAVYSQAPVITAVAFSPAGSHLAVSAYREVLIVPVSGEGTPIRLSGLSERIHSIAFSPDGSRMIAAGGTPARFGEVQVWDVPAAKLLRSITLTGDTVFGASLSPDASTIAVGCADNTVRVLDANSGKELHRIGNHENWVLGTVFGKDGKRLVSVGRDRAAKLTDVGTGAFLENINKLRGELTAIARHPSQDIIVIAGEDRLPWVYKMDRPKNMKIADDTTMIRELERQDGAVFALAWSPDGSRIAVAGAGPEITLYNAETGARERSLKGHKAGIYALAWSPDSKTLVSGGFDGQLRFYEAASGKLVRESIPVPLQTTSANTRAAQ